jgi:hypothetical protein
VLILLTGLPHKTEHCKGCSRSNPVPTKPRYPPPGYKSTQYTGQFIMPHFISNTVRAVISHCLYIYIYIYIYMYISYEVSTNVHFGNKILSLITFLDSIKSFVVGLFFIYMKVNLSATPFQLCIFFIRP